VHYSELAEVFSREELHKAFQETTIPEEKIYNPKDQLVAVGEKGNHIVYICRGILLEKDGDIDDLYTPAIKFKRGSIACLQNLLPDAD
jgi:hypothetical protein